MVLRHTGLPDEHIERLAEDNPRNCKEIIYKGFCICFSDPSINVSVEQVLQVLEKVQLRRLAEELRKKLSDRLLM